MPQKNLFVCGLNRHYQGKLTKNKKLHIIKTMGSFSTNFAQQIRPPNTLFMCGHITEHHIDGHIGV